MRYENDIVRFWTNSIRAVRSAVDIFATKCELRVLSLS
jgi:hypothetical protein